MQESGSNGFDDGMHCVTPTVPLLPALLKAEGFATHALGKWDVGYVQRHCLPTTRGFDTFLVRAPKRALCRPAASPPPPPYPDPLARLCVRPGLLHPVHLGLLVPRRARRRPRQEQVRRRRFPRQRSGGDQARRHVGAGLFERNLCVKRSQCNSQLHSKI